MVSGAGEADCSVTGVVVVDTVVVKEVVAKGHGSGWALLGHRL
jgi:hypothetical protein